MDRLVEFGDCSLRGDGLLITPDGERQLSPRLAVVLRALVRSADVAVGRDTLLDAYWGKGAGSQQSVAKTMFELRAALAGSRLVRIESVYGYGYRLRALQSETKETGSAERAKAICDEAAHRVYDRRDISLKTALSMYEMATHIDSGYGPARTGYVETWLQLLATGQEAPKTGWPAARQAVDETLAHDLPSPTTLAQLGLIQCLFEWDFSNARASLANAVEADPTGYRTNDYAGRCLLFRGRPEQAVERLRIATEANPVAMNTAGLLAYALGCMGDIDGARRQVAELKRIDPGNPMTQTYFGWVEAAWGDPEEGFADSAKAHEHAPRSATLAAVHAFALAQAGKHSAARSVLSSLNDRSRYSTACNSVASHAWRVLGDTHAAVEALAAGADERDYWLGMMLHDPRNAPLRKLPEFHAVYQSVFPEGRPK